MAKRVAIVLSGCGARDGSDIREAVLAQLSIERAGGQVVWAAPEREQGRVIDHLSGNPVEGAQPRRVLVEAARIARGEIRDLASLSGEEIDASVFPGGEGVASVLSNFAEKAGVCDVHPDVVRLLKGHLASHRPMGFVGLAPVLAARVLGPVAGVRITLGPRASTAAKHAAVMGADVRPCTAGDIFIDKKNRVISTPGYMVEEIRLTEVAGAIEKLVRTLLHFARDRNMAPRPDLAAPAAPRVSPGGVGQGVAVAGAPAASQARGQDGGPLVARRRPGFTPGRGSA